MRVTHFEGYDWEGVYLDGILVEEGHSVKWQSIIEALMRKGKPITEFDNVVEKGNWLIYEGNLPETLDSLLTINGTCYKHTEEKD